MSRYNRQTNRWPVWRVLCAALVMWVPAVGALILNAPDWATFGFLFFGMFSVLSVASILDHLERLHDV